MGRSVCQAETKLVKFKQGTFPLHEPVHVICDSPGQAFVLQDCTDVTPPVQRAPPAPAGVATLLVLPCRPPPHDAEHSPQALQELQTQGWQAAVLQAWVDTTSLEHPPLQPALEVTPLVLPRWPPPHSTEHPAHWPHGAHSHDGPGGVGSHGSTLWVSFKKGYTANKLKLSKVVKYVIWPLIKRNASLSRNYLCHGKQSYQQQWPHD